MVERLKKDGERKPCTLIVRPYGVCEGDTSGNVRKVYPYFRIRGLGIDDRSGAVIFSHSSRSKVYFSRQADQVMKLVTLIGYNRFCFASLDFDCDSKGDASKRCYLSRSDHRLCGGYPPR